VSKKVSGSLHEETIYSPPQHSGVPHVRKALVTLTKSEVEDIADPQVRKIVHKKLAELGIEEPKKAFADENRLPCFETQDGRRILIKRVRVKKRLPTFAMGESRGTRYVTSESNHHVELYAPIGGQGNDGTWDGEVISMFQAYQRRKARTPIVQRDHGPLAQFKFSLAPGEVIECDDKRDGRSLYVLRKVSKLSSGQLQVGFAPISDARKAKEMRCSRAWLWVSPATLSRRHPRKVIVNALGEVSEAHD